MNKENVFFMANENTSEKMDDLREALEDQHGIKIKGEVHVFIIDTKEDVFQCIITKRLDAEFLLSPTLPKLFCEELIRWMNRSTAQAHKMVTDILKKLQGHGDENEKG